jgi:hypothetical protein
MSVYDFLIDFIYAAKEFFRFCLDLVVGLAKGTLLALNEMLFVFPQAYVFWGMIALVLALILGDTMNKALQEDQRRHELEYQRQLKIKREIEAQQEEQESKRRAAEERARQIRQSLRLPVGVIKQQQLLRQALKAQNKTHRHH